MYKREKEELIYWAHLLNQKGYVRARNGNISYKVGKAILITAHDAYLGQLEEKEILLVDPKGNILKGGLALTAEKDLHLSIHKRFKNTKVVLHAHPPYTIAFFHYFDALEIFSLEARVYLDNIKVIPQDTPSVTKVEPVLKALQDCKIVVLKDHGVVSIGSSFKEAFSLIELLEGQAEVNLLTQALGLEKRVHS
jgi:L-fuculose-phosphate aldolase